MRKVAKGRTFYRNNKLDAEYPPLPRNIIVERANYLVGSKWDYSLLSANCEHRHENTPQTVRTQMMLATMSKTNQVNIMPILLVCFRLDIKRRPFGIVNKA